MSEKSTRYSDDPMFEAILKGLRSKSRGYVGELAKLNEQYSADLEALLNDDFTANDVAYLSDQHYHKSQLIVLDLMKHTNEVEDVMMGIVSAEIDGLNKETAEARASRPN